MTEIENQNIEENQKIQENTIQQTVDNEEGGQEESLEQINWRKFREARKQERQQLVEREREIKRKQEENEALKKALEAVVTPNHAPAPQQTEDYSHLYGSEQVNEKHILDKVNSLLEQKEREREERKRQEEHANFPQRLQHNYNDFNHVCNTENLDYLEYHYPEVAKPLAMLPDGYEKWEGIYKAVKRFIPNLDKETDMKKIDKNLSKPVAMSRPGMTSTTEQAPHISLSDEQRAKNWERMRKVMKGI